MGRKRSLGERKPGGRLKQAPRLDNDVLQTALTRMRDFGVTLRQSVSPFAGYLAGVLFLRGKISARQLGHFYSFLQTAPGTTQAIHYGERVQTSHRAFSHPINSRYVVLARAVGRDIDVLHALSRDELTVEIKVLREVLERVPLSRGGYAFSEWARMQKGSKTRPK